MCNMSSRDSMEPTGRREPECFSKSRSSSVTLSGSDSVAFESSTTIAVISFVTDAIGTTAWEFLSTNGSPVF